MKSPVYYFRYIPSRLKPVLFIVSLTCTSYAAQADVHLTEEQITGLIQIANATGADITITKGKHREVFLHTDHKTSNPKIKEFASKTMRQKYSHAKQHSSSLAPEPSEFANTATAGNTASFVSPRLPQLPTLDDSQLPKLDDSYFLDAP